MEEKNIQPVQKEGASTDITDGIILHSVEEAKTHFQKAKDRLLHVSDWDKISKGSPSEFKLTTSAGEEVWREAQEGDYFKIKIPAPGPEAGKGYDWVRIHSIKHESDQSSDSELLAMMVKPAADPTSRDQEKAHFFSDKASSTFIVKRIGKAVSAEVHGRNEVPNTDDTGIMDTIRNTVVALGAMLGFSEIQWKALVKGLIAND